MAASVGFCLLLQVDFLDYVRRTPPVGIAVLVTLFIFSVSSWTIIFSKWSALRRASKANARFLRAFRKANGLEAVMVASEQFRPSPLVSVFDFGYTEIPVRELPVARKILALDETATREGGDDSS